MIASASGSPGNRATDAGPPERRPRGLAAAPPPSARQCFCRSGDAGLARPRPEACTSRANARRRWRRTAPPARFAPILPDLLHVAGTGGASGFAQEAVQRHAVTPFARSGEQEHLATDLGQVVEGAHQRLQFVAHAMDVDHQPGRRLGIRMPFRRPIIAPPSPCAPPRSRIRPQPVALARTWARDRHRERVTASARRLPCSPSMIPTMCWTCLVGVAAAHQAQLDFLGRVFADRQVAPRRRRPRAPAPAPASARTSRCSTGTPAPPRPSSGAYCAIKAHRPSSSFAQAQREGFGIQRFRAGDAHATPAVGGDVDDAHAGARCEAGRCRECASRRGIASARRLRGPAEIGVGMRRSARRPCPRASAAASAPAPRSRHPPGIVVGAQGDLGEARRQPRGLHRRLHVGEGLGRAVSTSMAPSSGYLPPRRPRRPRSRPRSPRPRPRRRRS